MSVNALVIIGLGALVGFLSGLFGVGGGFLTTPLLIFYGIPPAIAVGSSVVQVTGSGVSGALAYYRRGQIDMKMGGVLIAGGFVGTAIGSRLFDWLRSLGQVDVTIGLVYVILLGSVGGLMLKESMRSIRQLRDGNAPQTRARRHHPLVAALPMKMRFPRSGVFISPLAPFMVGAGVGVLTVIMGVGGGFILVPAMLYLLGMAASVVVGTSLFQIILTTTLTSVLQAGRNQTVDIVLATLLLIGGVMGAQLGAKASSRFRAEELRAILALIVLAVGLRMGLGLFLTPDEPFVLMAGAG